MATDEKKFEWNEHHLREGFGFTMPDGRAATLIAHGQTPWTWLVMFSDSMSGVLTQEFILSELNNPTKREDSGD